MITELLTHRSLEMSLPQYLDRLPQNDEANLMAITSQLTPDGEPIGLLVVFGSSVKQKDPRKWHDIDIKILRDKGIPASYINELVTEKIKELRRFRIEKDTQYGESDYPKDCLRLYPRKNTNGAHSLHLLLSMPIDTPTEDYLAAERFLLHPYVRLARF